MTDNMNDNDDLDGQWPREDSWDIRILRPLGRIEDFVRGRKKPVEPVRKICVIDCETTGTDPDRDQIIDLAYVILAVDAQDDIVGIVAADQALNDPQMDIPPRITLLTGITNEAVAGYVIDLDQVEWDFEGVDVFIAHNCAFDLAFIRQLLPSVAHAPWACSLKDYDWLRDASLDGRALGHLLMQIGFYSHGHRAMVDVVSLIHLLCHQAPGGIKVLSQLLVNAARPTVRIEANGAPYSVRSLLRNRGYRWDPARKVWWTEIAEHEADEEELWLARNAIGLHAPRPRRSAITWHERHR